MGKVIYIKFKILLNIVRRIDPHVYPSGYYSRDNQKKDGF